MIDRKKAIREAALLRNLLTTCVTAASDPMTGKEIFDWPSIKEYVGSNTNAYSRMSTQLQRLVKEKTFVQLGKGFNTTYTLSRPTNRIPPPDKASIKALPELHVRINKVEHSIRFVFEGLAITLEVL
jgi:hypothetical protein